MFYSEIIQEQLEFIRNEIAKKPSPKKWRILNRQEKILKAKITTNLSKKSLL